MNCLRANPNLIDGACNVLNKRIDHTDFSEDDMAKLSALFSTRFNRAHELNFLNPGNAHDCNYSNYLQLFVVIINFRYNMITS